MGQTHGDNPVLGTTLTSFQKATSGGLFRGRDELKEIDWALSTWQNHAANSPNPSMRKVAIEALMNACQRWQALKQNKQAASATPLLAKRWAAVEALVTELSTLYRFEAYQEKKQKPAPIAPNEMKGMHGVYAFEAPAVKRTPHVSASEVKVQGPALLQRPIATRQDYDQAEQMLRQQGAELQVYLTRAQRLEYMLIPIHGRLMRDPFTPVHIPSWEHFGIVKGGGPYAVDACGNFFSIDERELGKEVDGAAKWNHSTFLRGKDVVCAGMIGVGQGTPTYISNESGHYAPTIRNVENAVRILVNNGVDVSRLFVRVFQFIASPSDQERALCEDHAQLSACKAARSAFGKMIEHAGGHSFLGDPDGRGFALSPITRGGRLNNASKGGASKWFFGHLA